MTISLDLKDDQEFAGGVGVRGCGNARKKMFMVERTAYVKVG